MYKMHFTPVIIVTRVKPVVFKRIRCVTKLSQASAKDYKIGKGRSADYINFYQFAHSQHCNEPINVTN